VKSVSRLGVQDVYNLEVEETHCFAVNGGLIVHNCIDSLRYALEGVRKGRLIITSEMLREAARPMRY
jgi:hypothetical protein